MQKDAVTEKFSVTANDGKNYLTQFYSLDAIILVGYRVNSKRATSFRIWAITVLKEYMIKKEHMGLTIWKHLPDKSQRTVGKAGRCGGEESLILGISA